MLIFTGELLLLPPTSPGLPSCSKFPEPEPPFLATPPGGL